MKFIDLDCAKCTLLPCWGTCSGPCYGPYYGPCSGPYSGSYSYTCSSCLYIGDDKSICDGSIPITDYRLLSGRNRSESIFLTCVFVSGEYVKARLGDLCGVFYLFKCIVDRLKISFYTTTFLLC